MRFFLHIAALLALVMDGSPAMAEREFRPLRSFKEQTGQAQAMKRPAQSKAVAPARSVRKPAPVAAQPAQVAKKPVVKHQIDERFQPQTVPYAGGHAPGTIVIDTKSKFLYLVEDSGTARRYGVAVGAEGLQFKGSATIRSKQEWPRWIPTQNMIQRQPEKYARYKDGMDGGPNNPLGARALYLFQGDVDTYIRIHGTNQPWTIGSAASNGCFRMVNEHVIDLFDRVEIGTEVVVM